MRCRWSRTWSSNTTPRTDPGTGQGPEWTERTGGRGRDAAALSSFVARGPAAGPGGAPVMPLRGRRGRGRAEIPGWGVRGCAVRQSHADCVVIFCFSRSICKFWTGNRGNMENFDTFWLSDFSTRLVAQTLRNLPYLVVWPLRDMARADLARWGRDVADHPARRGGAVSSCARHRCGGQRCGGQVPACATFRAAARRRSRSASSVIAVSARVRARSAWR